MGQQILSHEEESLLCHCQELLINPCLSSISLHWFYERAQRQSCLRTAFGSPQLRCRRTAVLVLQGQEQKVFLWDPWERPASNPTARTLALGSPALHLPAPAVWQTPLPFHMPFGCCQKQESFLTGKPLKATACVCVLFTWSLSFKEKVYFTFSLPARDLQGTIAP